MLGRLLGVLLAALASQFVHGRRPRRYGFLKDEVPDLVAEALAALLEARERAGCPAAST